MDGATDNPTGAAAERGGGIFTLPLFGVPAIQELPGVAAGLDDAPEMSAGGEDELGESADLVLLGTLQDGRAYWPCLTWGNTAHRLDFVHAKGPCRCWGELSALG